MRTQKKIVWVSAVIMACMAMALLLPQILIAGSLEPPPTALDGSGNPVATVQIPPAWSQKLQCDGTACPRFELVMDGLAVLDKETGLVWQKEPGAWDVNWYDARSVCYVASTGGRKGWRLPTAAELLSLIDPSQSDPALPIGHPFDTDCSDGECVQWDNVIFQGCYWTDTTVWQQVITIISARCCDIYDGECRNSFKDQEEYVWCVRGGQGKSGH